jgi:RimJ/RimL family protein N-acetyltransferase
MNIIKINDYNIYLLEAFIKNKLPDSFRYFNSRPISVINSHLITIIGVIKNSPIAYAHIDYEHNIYWFGICVLEEYQGLGYGTQIMDYINNFFNTSKIEKLNLTVDKNNITAINLYKKYGFCIISELETYYKMEKSKNNNVVYLPVSYGEALDKLTILEIKLNKITDNRRLDVEKEYFQLYDVLKDLIAKTKEHYDKLKDVNLSIWIKQDIFRDTNNIDIKQKLCIEIIEENDERFRIKNKINTILNSSLKEQKGYKNI